MSLLLFTEIADNLLPPAFGGDFAAHLARKSNPTVRRASIAAWSLLAAGLARLGCNSLPDVRFSARGKPEFIGLPLHFSLAHSGSLAAALISDAPCGVDIERIRPEVADRLRARCLSPEEQCRDLDFFECWTKKECIGKRTGDGIDAHPAQIDTLDERWSSRFFYTTLLDSANQPYALSALCEDAAALQAERI